jgi:hypothetical protein
MKICIKHRLVNVALDRVLQRILAKTVMHTREIKMAGNSLATGRVKASVEQSATQFFYAPLNGSDTKW